MPALSPLPEPCKTHAMDLDQLGLFESEQAPSGQPLLVAVDRLDEDPDNPRTAFPPEAIEDH
jgi:hypothetical protein